MVDESQTIISKAPARICLFGDHQDYINLPIIACAIDRYIEIKARPTNSSFLHIILDDLEKELKISIDDPLVKVELNDFLRLALRVLARYNCKMTRGFEIHIKGNIPINAGLSSSSALTIAWINFLITAFGIEGASNAERIAQLAYETEVLERQSSGGQMDQYAISLGEMIFLDTKSTVVEFLEQSIDGLIVGVSGIPKDTFGTLAHLKDAAWESINLVQKYFPDFDIHQDNGHSIEKYLNVLPPALKPIFEAAVQNYEITKEAFLVLKKQPINYTELGQLINAHHQLLRDNLKITVPLIDAMINAALNAGAYGAKIVGSGLGGCIIALAPNDKKNEVLSAIKKAGAVDAFSCSQSIGAQVLMERI